MTPFSLAGSAVLVTGSSQGIGHAIALAAHAAGARVVLHGREAAAPAQPADCPYLYIDLLTADGAARLVREAFALEPGLDRLVCNAGSFFDVPFLDVTPEIFERTLNLNVRANYFVAQAFARELVARGRAGAIVTTTSTNGFQPEDDSSAYDTSKGAMVMMTRTLAQWRKQFTVQSGHRLGRQLIAVERRHGGAGARRCQAAGVRHADGDRWHRHGHRGDEVFAGVARGDCRCHRDLGQWSGQDRKSVV